MEHQDKLLTYNTDPQYLEKRLPKRPKTPVLYSVFPDRASLLTGANNAFVARGQGLSALKAVQENGGAQVLARRRDLGPGARDWIDLMPTVTDTKDRYVTFTDDRLSQGQWDIAVRSGDGQITQLDKAVVIDQTASTGPQVWKVENFQGYNPGAFPTGDEDHTRIWSNASGTFRVTDTDARIGDRCVLFKGVGNATPDIVRMALGGRGTFGNNFISMRFSLRLTSVPLTAGQVLAIQWWATSANQIFRMTFDAATTFFTFTVSNQLLGSGPATVPTTTPLDTEWHDIEVTVSTGGQVLIYFDQQQVGSPLSATGAIMSFFEQLYQVEISNGVTVGVTNTSMYLDRIVTADFYSGNLTV